MKKISKYPMILLTALTLSGAVAPNFVAADSINYSVKPTLPDNNLNESYYKLLMEPGQNQTISMKITNSNTSEKVYDIKVIPALTQENGQVAYSPSTAKPDESMKYDISKMVEYPKEISIKGGESKDLNVKVLMPNENINGVIAGSIVVKERVNEEEKAEAEDKGVGFGTTNEFQYATGFLITQQKEPNVQPEIKIGDISAGQLNLRNVVRVHLQNPTQNYVNDVDLNATITSKDDPNLKFNYSNDQIQFAPTSSFDLPIPISTKDGVDDEYSEPMKPGKYTLKMTAYANKSDNGKYEVKGLDGEITRYDYKLDTTKEFTITDDEADRYNKTDVTINPKDKSNNNIFYIVGGGIIALIAAIGGFFAYRKKLNAEK